jgi:hypothetical protein
MKRENDDNQEQSRKAYPHKTRQDWLIHFRQAVSHETLDHMANRLWDSIQDQKMKLIMWQAYGDRQEEIDRNVFVKKVKFPTFH